MSGNFDFNLDPYSNFLSLYEDATKNQLPDPHAMSLATVSKESKPSVRIVYYKGILRGGFSFYTNYQGKKSQDLESNSYVCTNFFWSQLQRQVRIEGTVVKTTRAESESYFKTRIRESQIGAWASEQSQPLESFEAIAKRFKGLEEKYKSKDVPCPPHWGGYLIIPEAIEFWFGRHGRMHERYKYSKVGSEWSRQFLNP
jgi:pyridoxamine 5'-phosphate oxidase